MLNIRQAVILAGGLGTRLRPFTYENPKPMIPIDNRPFLEHLILTLKENDIADIVLLLGYLPEKITDYFGDGSKFGVKIQYSISEVEDETGTRIRKAGRLIDDIFLSMYCDNYWPLNLKKLTEFFQEKNTLASVTVYTNKDAMIKNNILVDNRGYVVKYDKTRQAADLNGVEIGYYLMSKEILNFLPHYNFSFEKEIIPLLIAKNQLAGYQTDQRYYSISTPEKVELTKKFLSPKKIIFIDRDGVINKKAAKADYIKTWAEFQFLPGALEALPLLIKNGYEIIIITNQAGIARRMMTEKDLRTIHENMIKEFNKHNIKIKAIYSCNHGWDDGCDCRKPKPGMFFQAARDYAIDLTKTLFIGDDERDGQAGEAAGIKTILVTPENNLLQIAKYLTQKGNLL